MFVKMVGVVAVLAIAIAGCDGAKSRGKKLTQEQIQRKVNISERQAKKSEFAQKAIKCSQIKDLKKVKVETACVTRQGKLFLRVDDGGLAGPGWQDLQTATVWYDGVARNEFDRKQAGVSLTRANQVCAERELDLPTADDFSRAAANGLSDVLCLKGSDCQGFKNKGFAFWSVTEDGSNPGLYWIYDLQANLLPGALRGNFIYDTVGGICLQK